MQQYSLNFHLKTSPEEQTEPQVEAQLAPISVVRAVPLLQQADQQTTALSRSFRQPAPVQGWNKDATAVDGPEMTALSLPDRGQEPEDRPVTPGVYLGPPAGFSRGLIPF